MKAQAFYTTIWAFIFTAIPFIYLAFIWDSLPAKVALDISQSNRIGSRQDMLVQLIMISIVGLFIYFGMAFSKYINPKQSTPQARNLSAKFGLIHLVFFSAIATYTVHKTIHYELHNLFFIILGLFLTAAGNFMHSIPFKHNYGLRTPWVRENEYNWRKTHQLASKLQFSGGLFIVAAALFLPNDWMFSVFYSMCFIGILVPFIYSYWLSTNVSNA
jgi:uncharacterized membrane protein